MTRRSPTALSPLVALCAALAVVLTHAAVALAQPAPQAPTPVRSRRDRLNPPAVVVAPGAATPAPGARPLPTAAAAPVAPTPAPGRPTGPAQVVAPIPGVTSVAGAAGTGANIHEFDAGMEYQALPPGARITFNLQDADLPDLIRAIGNITGRRFILPGKVRSIKTTIYSPTKVTPSEAYQAFLSVLAVNGMTVVPSGRYLKVEETAGAATQVLPTYGSGQDAPTDDRFITRIVRLRSISADDASTVLGHFKSRDGDITPYAATNTLIITDLAANIRRMLQILGEVDVSGVGEQIWVEPVHYALASELATRLTEILGGGAAAGAAARPATAGTSELRLGRILADDRSNSLVIVATQRMYVRVLELLRRLDVSIDGEGQVRVLRLQHGDAEEMATVLNNITGGGRQAGAAGQNPRGTNAVFEGPVRITADKPSNALVITSSPRDYIALRRVIDELDRSRRQVFIEAVVMELSINRSNRLGLNFHGALPLDESGQQGIALGGFNPLSSIIPSADTLTGLALGVRGQQVAGSQNLIPGIGVSIPAFGVTLNALASTGDANVLSTPHIIATDNSPADINVGQNVPLQTNIGGIASSLAGAAGGQAGALAGLLGGGQGFSAPRQDVGTKIRIVPHINDSNEVRLEIDEEISEVGASAGGQLGAVTINRRTAKTVVVVRDQNTVVIGGLIRNTDTNTETRIPILGDIPILGALFRNTTRATQRSNLLLILTPYVIRDQSDLRRIFERKMRERQEFLDRYFVFGEQDYEPPRDYSRTNGLVEEIRQSIRELRGRAEFESSSRPVRPPPHQPGESIELPVEARTPTAPGATAAPSAPGSVSAGVPVPNAGPVLMAPAIPAAVPSTP
ncbi:MAG: type II secretion system protein GspD [Myxococcaceae bacterium]|nr:MAG: type II secretion system protein GspD [Myxococcaceae bacterium]